ncbi:MAG: ATP-dependent sacrificial sulfur transferase LarE [Oscillospiraceae bacterium]|nr:ATP-dependent sacrificial sulfur transferase LarE [Oscillospiraceae bacterium]
MQYLNRKYEKLKEYFLTVQRIAVAFSGGVDSAFLLASAKAVLEDSVIAVMACTPFVSKAESFEAVRFCNKYNIPLISLPLHVLDMNAFRSNPPDRCYHCKKILFQEMKRAAMENGYNVLVDGSNLDDLQDYRPGKRALQELEISSPLQEFGFTKSDIRQLSLQMGLPTWDKPSLACLASRIPYGQPITEKALAMIEIGEDSLSQLGIIQKRVRLIGEDARIEVLPQDFMTILEHRDTIIQQLKDAGFRNISLDLQGFRSGSMNDGILKKI